MKKPIGLIFLSILFAILVACTTQEVSSTEEEVKEFIEKYKKEQYTISNYKNPPSVEHIEKNVQSYLSQELQEKHHMNRVFSIAPELAKKMSKNMKVENVQVERESKGKDGTIDYKYTLTINIYDHKSFETVKKDGELTLSTKNGYKIIYENEKRDTKIGKEQF